MSERNRPGATTQQALTTEVIGVRVVTRSGDVPFGGEIADLFAEINVVSTDFHTGSVWIGDLNDQIAGPSGIIIKVGECQIDTQAGKDTVEFDFVHRGDAVAVKDTGVE